MAETQAARFHTIIDLTEEDGGRDQLRTLSSAASKAQAAATRLTTQFESLTSPPNGKRLVHGIPNGGNYSFPRANASIVKPDLYRDWTDAGETKAHILTPKPAFPGPSAGPRLGISAPQTVLPSDERFGPIPPPRLTNAVFSKGNGDLDISSTRPPRAAAQSAGQMITKTYDLLNPLEAQREASYSTPRKPGRPKVDHWTPKSHSGHGTTKTETRDAASRSSPVSPVPHAANVWTAIIDDDSSAPEHSAKSRLNLEHKRKRQKASPNSGLPSKHAKLDDHSSKPLSNAEPSNLASVGKELSPLSRGSHSHPQSQVIYNLEDEPTGSAPISALETMAARPNAVKPRKDQGSTDHEGLERIVGTSAKGAHGTTNIIQTPSDELALRRIFETLVYTSIKFAQRPFKGQIPASEMFSIGKAVSEEVMEQKIKRLPPASLSRPSQEERLEIRTFVKERIKERMSAHVKGRSKELIPLARQYDFHRKSSVRHLVPRPAADAKSSLVSRQASTQASTVSASKQTTADRADMQPTSRPGQITDLNEYLKKLENETLPKNLDDFQNSSPVRPQPHSNITDPAGDFPDSPSLSASSKGVEQNVHYLVADSLNETPASPSNESVTTTPRIGLGTPSETSSFPPGFDRGRYPYQRRRRGNKHYTPGRSLEAAVSNQKRAVNEGNRQASIARSNILIQTGDYSSDSSQEASQDTITQSLIACVAADPGVKSLLTMVASGKASSLQAEAFQELTEELNYSRAQGASAASLSRFIQPVKRKLATSHDPYSERVAAVLATDEPENPILAKKMPRHFIRYIEREQLVAQPSVFRCVDRQTNKSRFTMIETTTVDPARRPQQSTASLMRNRELGSDSRGRNIETYSELRLRNAEQIQAWRYWKGASGDVVAAAWSSDSITYAIGAAAHTNSEDVQYNRPCNLLLGDLTSNSLLELPDHRMDRPKPETLADTYNARQAVYNACDPMVYETVSSIGFSPTSNRMYTASNDCTVKIWDTTRRTCIRTLHHDAKVISVETSPQIPGVFATGSDVTENSVRVYYTGSEDSAPLHVGFSSSRAQARQEWKVFPECLRWGPSSYTSHLLLAGFRQKEHDENQSSREGQLCLWDANAFSLIKVSPSSQAVLAAAWHPTLPFFATGGSPGSNLTDKRTKTVVRTWDLRTPQRYTMEYECSAADMQDVTFHPTNSHIVTAGCTDGTSFVWDFRQPYQPLHRLRHGDPLVDWDHTRGQREDVDTGVMLSLWGLGGSLFYTGSSDGMIKAWDIRRHPQDVLHRNVAQFNAGIQCGAISPDGTNLLAGDAVGGVHVLSSAPCGPRPDDDHSADASPELPITLIRAPSGSGLALNPDEDHPGTEGREEAKHLTESGQIRYDPELGITQGEMYHGPYANQHRKEAVDVYKAGLLPQGDAESKHYFFRLRGENEEVEARRRGLIAARKQRIAALYPALGGPREEVEAVIQGSFQG